MKVKKRLLKSEQGRSALRQAIKVLEETVGRLQNQKNELEKALEDEKMQRKLEQEVAQKELTNRRELEREICRLKEEILALKEANVSSNQREDAGDKLATRVLELEEQIKRLEESLEQERHKGDLTSKYVDVARKQAEAEKKKAEEAKRLANAEKNKADQEKRRADQEKRRADIEKSRAEEQRCVAEAAKKETEKERATVVEERAKVKEANERATAEKKKVDIEKKRADSEMKISQELKKSLVAERKKSADEKIRAEKMCRIFEDERKRRETLEKELQNALSARKENKQLGQYVAEKDELREDKYVSTSGKKVKKSPKEKLLKEKLKLRIQQLEQVQRMVKVEKSKKNLLQLEVSLLKQDAVQFSHRLDILEKVFSSDMEHMNGSTLKADQASIDFNCKASKRLCKFIDQNKVEFRQGQCRTLECLNCHGPSINSNGFSQAICGDSCKIVLSGTNTQLEPTVGVSVQNRSQSSTIYSTTSSFSDRKLNNSQGKDVPSVDTSVELGKVSLVQEPFVDKVAIRECQGSLVRQCNVGYCPDGVIANQEKPASTGLVPESEVEKKIPEPKVRGHGDVLRSIKHLCSKNLKSNLKIKKMFGELQGKIPSERGLQVAHPLSGHKCKKRKHHAHKSLYEQNNDHHKKRKISGTQNVFPVLQLSDQVEAGVARANRKSGGMGDAGATDSISSPVVKFVSKDKELGRCFEGQEPAEVFNYVIGTNVLKLLEMDDSADEERYRVALKEPLSPTFPELYLYESQEADGSISLIGKSCLNERQGTMPEIAVPSQAFDVFHAEIQQVKSNNSREGLPGKLIPQSPKSTKDQSMNCQGLVGPEFVKALVLDDAQRYDTAVIDSKDQECFTSSGLAFSEGLAKDKCENGGTDKTALMVVENFKSRKVSTGLNTDGVDAGHPCNDFIKTCSTKVDVPKISSVIGEDTKHVSSGHNHFQVDRKYSKASLVSEAMDEVETDDCQHIVPDTAVVDEDMSFDDLLGSMEAMEASMVDLLESGDELGDRTPIFPADDLCRENSSKNCSDTHNKPLKHLIVFPDIEDEAAILRICWVFEAFISQKTCISGETCVVEELITFLSMRLDLRSKEWVCVFFSLLLYNFSINFQVNSRSNLKTNPSLDFNSLLDQLKDVLIVRKKDCRLELLLILIEEFLINGRILLFADSPSGLLVDRSNIKELTFDGREIFLSSQVAPVDLIAGGSIILACICSAVDRSGFLLEASYSILRLSKRSPLWILTVLHSFSSVCGDWYLAGRGCRLVASVVQSVVSFLERGDEFRQGKSSLCELMITDNGRRFPPCAECPFAKGAISMDEAIKVLLREMEDLSLQFNVSVGLLKKRSKPCLFCLEHLGHGSDHSVGSSSCSLVDPFSLVELLAFYMGWDWTYNKVVPALWKLLESSVADDLFAAVIILIGHLGRLGIDASGYEEQGVEQLRCNLSEFLNQKGRCLLVQLAAVVGILNLLSMDFVKCTQKNASIDVHQSHHVEMIKKWFSELSDHEQSNALCLLEG
ncbi:unnamed protein product [Victoria cruziana]